MALDDVGLLGLATLFAIGANVPCFAPGSFNAASALWPTYDSGLSVVFLPLFREAVLASSAGVGGVRAPAFLDPGQAPVADGHGPDDHEQADDDVADVVQVQA
jgi:hypothetical protein